MDTFSHLINVAVREGISDLHITGGHPIVYRNDGIIGFDRQTVWSHPQVDSLAESLLSPMQLAILRRRLSVDVAKSVGNVRLRINMFTTTRGVSLAIRLLPGTVPKIDALNLHPSLKEFCRLTSGLMLVCGTNGSGKSTTVAAMMEEINQTRAAHIVTLEDPIEYRFLSKKSFVEQRELGAHFPSFEQGLVDVLREDPDVIVVGELRDPQTMRLTLNAAESGHLVIATLHATNTEDALHRICNSFPPEASHIVFSQLPSTLAVLVVQQLIYLERAAFRVPLLSILLRNQAVKGLIRENKLSQIENAMQTGREDGMFTLDQYRKDFLDKNNDFVPPSEVFRPSAEATAEIVYRSPLVEQPAEHPAPTGKPAHPPAPAAGKPQVIESEGAAIGVREYVIDEDLSMDEVLAMLGKRG
jgi:twitching motility protein PilT